MMKKRSTADVKQRAANDKSNGNSKPKKAPKSPNPEEKFTLGAIETVKRGFLLEFVKFIKAKGTVDVAMLIAEFNGRQFDGRKVTVERIHRYIAYSQTTASSGRLRRSKVVLLLERYGYTQDG
jgi:hypothetical protein